MQVSELSPYHNFVYALKSKDVKRQYPVMLTRFLNFIDEKDETLEEKCLSLYKFAIQIENRKSLEYQLMRYIGFQEERIKRKEISSGTLRNYVKAIKLFFTMNDILVNWDKIKMGMPTVNQTSNDRIPEILEINRLLDYNDIRIKPIVLIMLSSGIRVGAWDWLKWKHVIPIEREGVLVAAKIVVYAGEPEQYFSFITPEAYQALKSYIGFRELHGEKISGESWLIRDQWQKINKTHGHRIGLAGKPKKLDAEGIRRLLYDSWKVQGVITNKNSDSEEKHHPFKSSHGFRKFFETHCEMVMKSEDAEILMGHGSSRRGLKANYYRPKENHLLDQYLKVVNSLTINEENKLKSKISALLDESQKNDNIINKKIDDKETQIKQLNEKYERDMQLLKQEMENKFQQLITKIDLQKFNN